MHIFFIIPNGITTCVTCCPNKSKGPPPPAPPPAPPCLGELLMRCLDLLPLARLDADSLTPHPHSLRPLQGKCHQLVRLEIEKARNLWGTRSWPRPRLPHAPLMGGQPRVPGTWLILSPAVFKCRLNCGSSSMRRRYNLLRLSNQSQIAPEEVAQEKGPMNWQLPCKCSTMAEQNGNYNMYRLQIWCIYYKNLK